MMTNDEVASCRVGSRVMRMDTSDGPVCGTVITSVSNDSTATVLWDTGFESRPWLPHYSMHLVSSPGCHGHGVCPT